MADDAICIRCGGAGELWVQPDPEGSSYLQNCSGCGGKGWGVLPPLRPRFTRKEILRLADQAIVKAFKRREQR